MGLLDDMLGSVVGSVTGGGSSPISLSSNSLVGGVLSMLQQQGGLEGVVNTLRQNGLSDQVDSWIGTGPNMRITPDQLQQGLGPSVLNSLAAKLGMTTGDAGSTIADLLPDVINQLTPAGQVPENHQEMISQALSVLGRSGGSTQAS